MKRIFGKIIDLFSKDWFQYLVYGLILFFFYKSLLKPRSVIGVISPKATRNNPIKTLTNEAIIGYVQRLESAINGFEVALVGYGTDESAIENIVDNSTPEDWRLIHNEFGKRPYSFSFGRVYSKDSFMKYALGENSLDVILANELSKQDSVYKKVKNMYSNLGISF